MRIMLYLETAENCQKIYLTKLGYTLFKKNNQTPAYCCLLTRHCLSSWYFTGMYIYNNFCFFNGFFASWTWFASSYSVFLLHLFWERTFGINGRWFFISRLSVTQKQFQGTEGNVFIYSWYSSVQPQLWCMLEDHCIAVSLQLPK